MMIDVKEAYDIVKKNNPNMKVFICNEGTKYYHFSLFPVEFAGSMVDLVDKKTGKYLKAHFTVRANDLIIREIDVSSLE